MKLRRLVITATVACASLACFAVAQSDDAFEALLQEISQPSPTAGAQSAEVPATEAPAAEVVAPAAEAAPEAAAEVAAEAAVVAEPVVEEAAAVVEEVAPVIEETATSVEAVEAVDASVLETQAGFEEAAAAAAEEPAPVVVEETQVEAVEEVVPAMEEAAPAVVVEEVVVEETVLEEPVMEESAPADMEEADASADAEEGVDAEDAASETTGDEAEKLAQQEEVRRQERELAGKKSLEAGLSKAQDYNKAIADLEEALKNIPDRPATKDLIAQAKASLVDAHLRKAKDALSNKNVPDAEASVKRVLELDPENRKAADLQTRVAREKARQEKLASVPVKPKDRPAVKEKAKSIADLLVEGRGLYKIGDYNGAEAVYEKILATDEYNVEAMRFLRKIDELRYDIKTKEREATSADMIAKVRDTWNPPIREEVELPEAVVSRTAVESSTGAEKLQKKMEDILIPAIEFRQANIVDVINFLVDASRAGDAEGAGVNIILNLNLPSGAAQQPDVSTQPSPLDDPFGTGGGFDQPIEQAPASESSNIPAITLNLRRVSLLNAIKYITEVAGLKYRIDENAVIITPEGVVQGRVITRFFPVQPSIMDVIVERDETPEERSGDFIEMGQSSTTIKKVNVKDFFEGSGVPFPVGTSITYNQSLSKLIVANTPENMERLERILAELNLVPSQVEIEARFVEIGQNDLEELGFQWILTDNYEFATRDNGAPIAGQERLQLNKDTDGITKGLRFFNLDTTTGSLDPASTVSQTINQSNLGNLLTFASVLTNPEMQLVVQALSQHGGTDLLSAPRVTTRSGVNAQIQVVTEIIYPTEFEVTQPTIAASTISTAGTSGGLVTPPTVTPGSFETRETGVILNVTPTVGPDGYTIDLVLAPEVAELVGWIQYGSTISAGGQDFQYNIPQPIFASRNVTTSMVIWDGQTVVMGGLIREDLKKIKDKIPLLGDIPFLGRLFRSEGEYSQKKNLLIFVSARLVDPSGKPIHRLEQGTKAEQVAAE